MFFDDECTPEFIFSNQEDLDLLLDSTDIVGDETGISVEDCLNFWGDGFNILHTRSFSGTWLIVSHSDDFSKYKIGESAKFEDYETGEVSTHQIIDKIILTEGQNYDKNMKVMRVGTFK